MLVALAAAMIWGVKTAEQQQVRQAAEKREAQKPHVYTDPITGKKFVVPGRTFSPPVPDRYGNFPGL